jgi:hypothetical protein
MAIHLQYLNSAKQTKTTKHHLPLRRNEFHDRKIVGQRHWGPRKDLKNVQVSIADNHRFYDRLKGSSILFRRYSKSH